MTTLTIPKPANPGFWAKAWHALRALDEAAHDDPAEAQRRRIGQLEARLKDLEANAAAGLDPPYSAQARLR
jgi:hypothetical protein